MFANYHTHTFRCKHAHGEDREYVEAAIRAGMKVLGFSDHCPWVFDDGYISGIRMIPEELDDYFDAIAAVKKEYADDIAIYTGFESEYIPELMEAQNELLKDYPIDYMILGEHFMGREPYSIYSGFPTNNEAILQRYVDLVIEGMETGKYLYVAHPDLLNFSGSDEIYEYHMLRLCRYLKEKNTPVEINLLGWIEKRQYPSERFLKIAQKAGNSAIIGVDAHSPKMLEYFKEQEACRMLAKKYDLLLVDVIPGLDGKVRKTDILHK
jgi:histidinol-phosphatase (PHP family)